jgi:pilus assembly protein CpaC
MVNIPLAPCRVIAVLLLLGLGIGDIAQAAEPAPAPAVPAPRIIPIEVIPSTPDIAPAGPPNPKQVVPLPIRPKPSGYSPQGATDAAPGEVLSVALNKARPIDLPAATQDVVIGNPAIADVVVRSPTQIFITGHGIGDTNVFLLDASGQLLRRVEIHVGPDAEGAHAAIAALLPDDDIKVSSVGDSLFLTGKARSQDVVNSARTIARRFVPADANVVNQITLLGAQQVMLRVRVAEMDRNLVKQLGVRTFFTQNGKQIGATLNGGNTSNVSNGGIGAQNPNYQFPVTAPSAVGSLPVQSQALFGSLPGTGNTLGGSGEYSTLASNNPGSWISVLPWNMLVNFAALEQEGLAKSLAEPNLVTLSGETARFLVGGEVPIPTASVNGVVTVEWKPFGVGLVFSPVILNNGEINLKLESEVSAIDNTISISTGAGITVPGFTTRRATTSVELPSGGSMMIAGLLQDNVSNSLDAVPGLRDVPVLGALFGSTAFQRQETELVVTVTAYLVNPVSHNTLDLPTDGFLPASDLKRYFLMSLQETYVGKPAGLSPTALKGPIGYIVE